MKIKIKASPTKHEYFELPSSEQHRMARNNKRYQRWLAEKRVLDTQLTFDLGERKREVEKSLGIKRAIQEPVPPAKKSRSQIARENKAKHLAWLEQRLRKANEDGEWHKASEIQDEITRYKNASRRY